MTEVETLYRITPCDKKSIEFEIETYQLDSQGAYLKGFTAQFRYRWGVGFREIDDAVFEYELRDGVHCDPTLGWGGELDDLVAVWVDFDGEWDAEEQELVRQYIEGEQQDDEGRSGEAWIFDGDHEFEIEQDFIKIYGPVKIDLVDAKGYGDSAVIKENIGTE